MQLRDKFPLFVALRGSIASLLPTLVLIFGLAGAAILTPAAASVMLSTSSSMHQQVAVGEALLARIAAPRMPERPAQCFDRHHPCGPDAIAAAHAEPFFLGLTQRVSFATPRAPELIPVPDVAPHLTASLSILYRNFRK